MRVGGDKCLDLCLPGDGFVLRPLTEKDASESYVKWLNDPQTTRFLSVASGSATIQSVRDYIASHLNRSDSLLLGIFVQPAMLHVGNVKLEPITFEYGRACIGMMIGEEAFRGQGLGGKVLKVLLDYAFCEMKLNRVELGVTADNGAAIKCYEKVGFIKEGVLRQATRRNGEYIDNYLYGMLAGDYRAGKQNGE